MRALTLDEFKRLEGGSFELVLGDRTIPFTLATVRPLPDSGREGGAFVLDWLGPYEPVLPQDIYAFRRADEEYEMFIVPTGRDRAGAQYEAVFN
ncbi:MAG TPA: hypothetical protein VFR28_06180 [Allosphingosinicella sp.]|jgi:hypothetical protein|nr:hypothetical protein [Allosphingosinicella sp.]